MRSPLARILVLACAALATASCQSPPEIHGRVTPRGKVSLSANAVLEVQVSDVSRPDRAPIVVARRRYTPLGAAPWPFTLRPDTLRTLDPDRGYAVQARVVVDGKPVLVNKRRTYVNPARLADTLDIVVEPVPRTVGVRVEPPVPTAPGLWNTPGRPATLPAPIPPPIASPAAGPGSVQTGEPRSQTERPECSPSPAR